VFGDDILLWYYNSFTPQTGQLNISTFITETGLFLQNSATCFTHHQAKMLQIHKEEGRTNVEKRPLSYMTLWVNKMYKNP